MANNYLSNETLSLLFLLLGLTIAVILRQLQKKFKFLPYSPSLFVISVFLGFQSDNLGVIGESINEIAKIDPRGILLIFLPPLVFESSFNSDWYIFRKQSAQIFILAFPSVLVSAILIMLSLKLVIGYGDDTYTWSQAFMFGSVLSCTDTVAVLSLLKEAGAPKKFNSLIEGQSLLNDGTCMVLFTISLQMCLGKGVHALGVIGLFVQLTLGAILLGVVFGAVSSWLIGANRNHPYLKLNITVAMCYLVYFTAEYVDLGIRVSGIMALVSMGLYMAAFGRTQLTHESSQTIHYFWDMLVFVAETIIFILGGVLVGHKTLSPNSLEAFGQKDVIYLIALYLCMMASRFLSIGLFMPRLKIEGYGLSWKEVVALTYGGLRGAVGIAFTMILAANQNLSPTFRNTCLFNMAGCSFLTLVINAPTTSIVIQKLGLCTKSDVKIKLFNRYVKELRRELARHTETLQKNDHLIGADWLQVEQLSGSKRLDQHLALVSPNNYGSTNIVSSYQLQERLISRRSIHDSADADPNLLSQIRNMFCRALKDVFWTKFMLNQCTAESVREVIECVNMDLDTIHQPLNSWQFLISHLHNPIFFPLCFRMRGFTLLKGLAFSLIYERVGRLYDVISTYLQGLSDCELIFAKEFCYSTTETRIILEESKQNRKLAQSYLDNQIKVAYPQIMKRIQTGKAVRALLTAQMDEIVRQHRFGQLNDRFYRDQRDRVSFGLDLVQRNFAKQDVPLRGVEVNRNDLLLHLEPTVLNNLMLNTNELIVQKDQAVIKAYEKQKFIYLVTRGEVTEEWRDGDTVVFKQRARINDLIGCGVLLEAYRQSYELTIIALSIAEFICIPINKFKQAMSSTALVQTAMQKELLLLEIRVRPNLALISRKLSSDDWRLLKKSVVMFRLSSNQSLQLDEAQRRLMQIQSAGSSDRKKSAASGSPIKQVSPDVIQSSGSLCLSTSSRVSSSPVASVLVMEGQIQIGSVVYAEGYYPHLSSSSLLIGPGRYFLTNFDLTNESGLESIGEFGEEQIGQGTGRITIGLRSRSRQSNALRKVLYQRD